MTVPSGKNWHAVSGRKSAAESLRRMRSTDGSLADPAASSFSVMAESSFYGVCCFEAVLVRILKVAFGRHGKTVDGSHCIQGFWKENRKVRSLSNC